jgi:hypothetical protein
MRKPRSKAFKRLRAETAVREKDSSSTTTPHNDPAAGVVVGGASEWPTPNCHFEDNFAGMRHNVAAPVAGSPCFQRAEVPLKKTVKA